MSGYDGPSIYNKQLDRIYGQSKSNGKNSKDRSNFSTYVQTKSLLEKNDPLQFNRSSTPFQVRKVPSPYYGLHPRPDKKREAVDYHLLKKRLQKAEEDFLLFEGFTEAEYTIERTNSGEKSKKPLKKRSGLSKSLSGIIQEEQHSIAAKNQTMSSLFSTHVLDKSDSADLTRK